MQKKLTEMGWEIITDDDIQCQSCKLIIPAWLTAWRGPNKLTYCGHCALREGQITCQVWGCTEVTKAEYCTNHITAALICHEGRWHAIDDLINQITPNQTHLHQTSQLVSGIIEYLKGHPFGVGSPKAVRGFLRLIMDSPCVTNAHQRAYEFIECAIGLNDASV